MDLGKFLNRMWHVSEWMSFFIAEKHQAVYVDPWIQDLDSFLDSMPSYEKVASGLYRGRPGVRDLLHEQFLMGIKIKPRFESLQRQLHQQGRKACVCRCIFEANGDTDYIGKTNLHIDKPSAHSSYTTARTPDAVLVTLLPSMDIVALIAIRSARAPVVPIPCHAGTTSASGIWRLPVLNWLGASWRYTPAARAKSEIMTVF